MFAGGSWGGSEGQKIMSAGLPLLTLFIKRGGGGGIHLFGVCVLIWTNMVTANDTCKEIRMGYIF